MCVNGVFASPKSDDGDDASLLWLVALDVAGPGVACRKKQKRFQVLILLLYSCACCAYYDGQKQNELNSLGARKVLIPYPRVWDKS